MGGATGVGPSMSAKRAERDEGVQRVRYVVVGRFVVGIGREGASEVCVLAAFYHARAVWRIGDLLAVLDLRDAHSGFARSDSDYYQRRGER